ISGGSPTMTLMHSRSGQYRNRRQRVYGTLIAAAWFATTAGAAAAQQQQGNSAGTTVTGRVIDSAHAAVAGAAVHVNGTAFGASTDARGTFTISGLAPGSY